MCFGSKPTEEDANNNSKSLNSRPVDSKPTQSSSSRMPRNDNYNYAPPSGPPPSHNHQEAYAPPPGPPPSQHNLGTYAPPPGPPPSHGHNEYSPPAGPPPSHSIDEYAPPPGPPPPVHDWQTAVPDTSLLPPPPSLGNQQSATSNATEQEAEQGEAWCEQNPMAGPTTFPQEALIALHKGEVGVVTPRGYKGDLRPSRPAGVWAGRTKSTSPDTSISSSIPLYSVNAHSPLRYGQAKTIYYEVRISKNNGREVSLALGYAAGPYPTFRQPGWHRGSLAVHGDDGSKFINDRWGGKDFTSPFKPGETLGLGMTFAARDLNAPPSYDGAQTTASTPINVEIFFTRNGRKDGGWNLHEEGDAEEDLPVTGLEGLNDLYAVIGTFQGVEFEIIFNPSEWKYRP